MQRSEHGQTLHPVSTVDFGGLQISYDDRVLEPRQWTLAQSRWAAELLDAAAPGPVLELCTGAGHMGLAAVASGQRDLVAVDLNPVACEFARHNAAAAGMAARVDVREGRVDQVLAPDERFPVVIADPPWVLSSGIGEFPDDPSIAIDGGVDGLDIARTCCEVIGRHLGPGGSAVVQVGSVRQVEALEAYLGSVTDGAAQVHVAEVKEYDRGVLVRLTR